MVKRKPKRRPLRVFGASLLTCEERGECAVDEKWQTITLPAPKPEYMKALKEQLERQVAESGATPNQLEKPQ